MVVPIVYENDKLITLLLIAHTGEMRAELKLMIPFSYILLLLLRLLLNHQMSIVLLSFDEVVVFDN